MAPGVGGGVLQARHRWIGVESRGLGSAQEVRQTSSVKR